MIQRLQTVFLFFAALAMALLFFFPYVEVANDDYFTQEYPVQTIFALIFIIGALVNIFLYRNRALQIRISRMLFWFLAAFIGYGIYQLSLSDFKNIEFERGTLLPLFAAYFLFRALTRINKDERLVKDMDRLR